MKKTILIIALIFSTIIIAQNNDNTDNRKDIADMNQIKGDSLITNTYNLEMNLMTEEPASPTNIFQDLQSASWKNFKRDQAGNIVYTNDGTEHNPYDFDNNGKVRWQDQANWSSREKQGMWTPMPYSYVSEDDVMWAKRITREIDLSDPNNAALKFPLAILYTNHYGQIQIDPDQEDEDGSGASGEYFQEVLTGIDARKNLYTILQHAALSGQVNVYNQRMSRLYSDTEIQGSNSDGQVIPGIFEFTAEVDNSVEDPITGIRTEKIDIEPMPISATEITSYVIVEDWFFDKRRSKMDVRIVSITPVAMAGDQVEERRECGTFYYPELRRHLSNHKVFNTHNMMDRTSFDEFFQRRSFTSYIVKESNVYDRMISSYINPDDKLSQLWEGERIKENIRSFESSMWEY